MDKGREAFVKTKWRSMVILESAIDACCLLRFESGADRLWSVRFCIFVGLWPGRVTCSGQSPHAMSPGVDSLSQHFLLEWHRLEKSWNYLSSFCLTPKGQNRQTAVPVFAFSLGRYLILDNHGLENFLIWRDCQRRRGRREFDRSWAVAMWQWRAAIKLKAS